MLIYLSNDANYTLKIGNPVCCNQLPRYYVFSLLS